MSLPTSLFIDSPEVQDASLHHLGNDIEAWPEEVIQKLKERIPQVAGLNTMVKFMKKDEENGAATGSVIINSTEKSAIVPLIIKDFMLCPLDVMIAEQKLLPLTPDYFDAIFSDNDIFSKIEEFPTFGGLGRFEDANLWNATYPPSLGRYAYASAGYPVLDAISDTIDGTEVGPLLEKEAATTARFYKKGHLEVLKKLANLRPVNMNEFRQGMENLIPKSIVMLRHEGPNKYTILSNSDSVFHPGMTAVTREQLPELMSSICDCAQDDINDVDQNGEKFLLLPEGGSPILARTDEERVESANEYDHYVVKSRSGISYEGVVIPKVIDFDQCPVDLKIFLSKDLTSLQPEIYGVRVKNSRYQPTGECPRVGQTGTFIYRSDKSHALATVPVTIKTIVQERSNDKITLKVADLCGRPLTIEVNAELSRGDSSLQRIAKMGDRRYSLPPSMEWVPMAGLDPVTNSVESYAVKTAGDRLTNWPVTLIPTGYDQYAMKGVNKYAAAAGWDATNLQRYQAKFLLASLGMGEEKIASTMKSAQMYGKAEIHNLKPVKLISEKTAEARPLAAHLTKIAKALRSNLFKEASYLENAQTVDVLLSLNFVTPDNVSKFVNKIPHFKSAISQLASCLVASRLGMQEIPEQAASTAMLRLIEVVSGLEKMRATQEAGVK